MSAAAPGSSPAGDAARAAAAPRVRVKICGVTRPYDAAAVELAGADAIGMIFAPSKRRVERSAAAEIVAAVGPFTTTVGVFRDAPLDEVISTLNELRLDVAQLHGDESEEYAAEVRKHARVLRALPFTAASSPRAVAGYPADAFLIDGPKPGSGQAYDWQAISAWRAHPRLVLAGGLSPTNVAAAVRALSPYAVDVASGVESDAGVKDHQRMRDFVEQVRLAERTLETARPRP